MILLIKSDSNEVEVLLYENGQQIAYKKWDAGRELSEQLLDEIVDICNIVGKNLNDVGGLVVYEGPGSYTGLRISISVANSLGYSYKIPVVGSTGDDWIQVGLAKLQIVKDFTPVSPVYGGEVFTTKPKK